MATSHFFSVVFRFDPNYLFHFFEIATAFTGALFGINPFNQPSVEEGKNLTYGMMGKKDFEEKRKEVEEHKKKRSKWRA